MWSKKAFLCALCSAAGIACGGAAETGTDLAPVAPLGPMTPAAAPMPGTPSAPAGGPAMSMEDSELTRCATSTAEAKPVPIDMFLMLDRSDAMAAATGAGVSKWDAVRMALSTFLSDPQSSGLSVGVQYFPIPKAGVPATCNADMACGSAGPCMNRLCEPPADATTFVPQTCAIDSECAADALGCHQYGVCATDQAAICFNVGPAGCADGGDCLAVDSYCQGIASCEPASYAKPAVNFSMLPGQAMAVTASLTSTQTIGSTPTAAVLSGMTPELIQRAMVNPSHRVVSVLVTGGLPSGCEAFAASSIGQLTQIGANANLKTYVVGVFDPKEAEGQANVMQWAKSGGTVTPYVIDASADAGMQLVDALQKIRRDTTQCEYALPAAGASGALDLDAVNVDFVNAGERKQLANVGDANGCKRTPLGWYYDANPRLEKPTKILTCDMVCDMVRTTSVRVDVRVGCGTFYQ